MPIAHAHSADGVFSAQLQPLRLSPAVLRGLLLVGSVVAAVAAGAAGDPAALLQADPELAHLLRGMAAIKATLVAAALGVLLWRFGQPIDARAAVPYLAGAWLITGATLLVWQLSHIVLAALVFHAGELTLLWVAWRDHAGGRRPQRQAMRAGVAGSEPETSRALRSDR